MQQYRNSSSLFWRVLKITPIIGMFFVLANTRDVIQRKGYVFGTAELILDLLPIVCLIKAGIEAYTGDIFPEKNPAPSRRLNPSVELA